MRSKCPICGAPVYGEHCSYCGYEEKIEKTILEPNISFFLSKKDKITALVLCIFLGFLGAHRFYVGKIGTGIIYMLTLGCFGIGIIVDIISIATGSFRDEFDLPLR